MAPEVVSGEYSFPADIWSVGIVAHELLTGIRPNDPISSKSIKKRRLIDTKEEPKKRRLIDTKEEPKKRRLINTELLTPVEENFITSLLQQDPSQRPTALEALQLPYLADEPSING